MISNINICGQEHSTLIEDHMLLIKEDGQWYGRIGYIEKLRLEHRDREIRELGHYWKRARAREVLAE